MLARAAIDADAGVRTAAIGFLGARSGGDATQALINLLDRADDQEKVLTALTTPVEGRVPVIAASLAVADDERAAQLVMALTRMHRADADQALVDGAPAGRRTRAKGGRRKASPPASRRRRAAALRRAAHDDPDPEVRRVATLLLSE